MSQSPLPTPFNIDRAAIRLTDTILGYDEQDLGETLKAIASEIGVRHIACLRFALDKGCEASLTTAIATHSRGWQTQYFLKDYVHTDPVVAHGRNALLPFDWEKLASDDPTVLAFFADAAKHGVGRNGLSIPVRNRRGPIRWFPTPAITPRRSGLDFNATIWPHYRSCQFSLIRPWTSTRSFLCPRSRCPGAKSYV